GRRDVNFENRIKRKDGTAVDALWSAQWSEEEKTFFCVAHDITGRKQIEDMKQRFLSMASHDLRAPLMAILGFIDLLSKGAYGEPSPKWTKMIGVAQRGIRRLINLINDLLDVERMEAGKIQLKPENIRLSSVVEASADAVFSFAEKHGVELDLPASDIEV